MTLPSEINEIYQKSIKLAEEKGQLIGIKFVYFLLNDYKIKLPIEMMQKIDAEINRLIKSK